MKSIAASLARLGSIATLALTLVPAAHAAGDDATVVAALGTPAPRGAAASDAYLDIVRQQLQRAGRYPTSREARHLRPNGTVAVWFELDGMGQVVASGIAGTSHSPILDDNALRAVRTAAFPAFGAAGTHRRFETTIDFAPAGS